VVEGGTWFGAVLETREEAQSQAAAHEHGEAYVSQITVN
jgi:hypothetical protein